MEASKLVGLAAILSTGDSAEGVRQTLSTAAALVVGVD